MTKVTTVEGLEEAMRAAEIAWWQMELPSGEVEFGKYKTDLLGLKQKNFRHYTDFTKLVHPDDYERMMLDMQLHLAGKKERYEALYRIKTKSGDYIQFYDRGKIISNDNGIIRLVGVVMNTSLINDFAYRITNS